MAGTTPLAGAVPLAHDRDGYGLAVSAGRAGEALCNGRIDAFVLPLSHPNGAVAAATRDLGAEAEVTALIRAGLKELAA